MWGGISLESWFAFPWWLRLCSLLMYLWAIFMDPLERYLFRSSAHILVRFFCCCCCWVVWVLYNLNISPYWMYNLQIFSPKSVAHLFILMFSLVCRSFLVSRSPTCLYLFSLPFFLVSDFKKSPINVSRSLPFKSFMVSGLLFKSLILLSLFLCIIQRYWSTLFFYTYFSLCICLQLKGYF